MGRRAENVRNPGQTNFGRSSFLGLRIQGNAPIYGTSSFGRIDNRSRAYGKAWRLLTTSLLNIDRLSGRDDAFPRRLSL